MKEYPEKTPYHPNWETMWQPLYSREPITDLRTEFFVHPVGMRDRTLADTNIYIASRLPRPNEFLIQGLSLWPDNLKEATQDDVSDSYLTLQIGARQYYIGNNVARFVPLDKMRCMIEFKTEMLVRTDMPFGVTVHFDVPRDRGKWTVQLYGYLYRVI